MVKSAREIFYYKKSRDKYEEEFESFKLGVMMLRKQRGLTQEQVAERCGTTKTYISRIENNASDISYRNNLRCCYFALPFLKHKEYLHLAKS